MSLRVDHRWCRIQQPCQFVDDDVQNEVGEFFSAARPCLDRSAVDDDAWQDVAGLTCRLLDAGQGYGLIGLLVDARFRREFGRRHVFDRELNVSQFVGPSTFKLIQCVQHQFVERFGTCAEAWQRGRDQ